jgi:hypothetical protein
MRFTWRGLGSVANSFDIVAVWIDDEAAVVGRGVFGAWSWSAVVFATGSESSSVEFIYFFVAVGVEGDVDADGDGMCFIDG